MTLANMSIDTYGSADSSRSAITHALFLVTHTDDHSRFMRCPMSYLNLQTALIDFRYRYCRIHVIHYTNQILLRGL
jgi:hypothetical protein